MGGSSGCLLQFENFISKTLQFLNIKITIVIKRHCRANQLFSWEWYIKLLFDTQWCLIISLVFMYKPCSPKSLDSPYHKDYVCLWYRRLCVRENTTRTTTFFTWSPKRHDDVTKRKHFRVTGHLCGEFPGRRWIHEGQWRGALMFSLICAWMKCWVNNREAEDLRRHRTHYDVTVMSSVGNNVTFHIVEFKDGHDYLVIMIVLTQSMGYNTYI